MIKEGGERRGEGDGHFWGGERVREGDKIHFFFSWGEHSIPILYKKCTFTKISCCPNEGFSYLDFS